MEQTKMSELLMCFLVNNNCLHFTSQSTNTKKIFKMFYKQIQDADEFIKKEKDSNANFYNLKLKKISNASDIPKPSTFENQDWYNKVDSHIDKFSYYLMTYTFQLSSKQYTIYFVLEKHGVEKNLNFEPDIRKFNKYVENMMLWLIIVNKIASTQCSNNIHIYVFMTSLQKELPREENSILGPLNINTAFTYSCPKTLSEIVIYREEEWFKVFIHESIHNFNLDFSSMNVDYCYNKMMELFHINIRSALYESYAEFWAKIMNVSIISYRIINEIAEKKEPTQKINVFLKYVDFLLNYEINHSYFQMVKVLKFNKLTYSQLYTDKTNTNNYKEDTNSFAYYVITLLLLSNYPKFLKWCYTNNSNHNVIQFVHSDENQVRFCNYIESQYKNDRLLKNITCSENLFQKTEEQYNEMKKSKHVKSKKHKNKMNEHLFTLNNLRLSLTEMKY